MKNLPVLKKFEYAIPPSAMASCAAKGGRIVAEHLPLMKVSIDFEKGELELVGDWQFMISSNKHNQANWVPYHRDRVNIKTTIYPALPVNLNAVKSDGLMLPMDGIINDGESIGGCSGLIIIDKVRGIDSLKQSQWNISFYLYDLQYDFCEITYKLPIYVRQINSFLN